MAKSILFHFENAIIIILSSTETELDQYRYTPGKNQRKNQKSPISKTKKKKITQDLERTFIIFPAFVHAQSAMCILYNNNVCFEIIVSYNLRCSSIINNQLQQRVNIICPSSSIEVKKKSCSKTIYIYIYSLRMRSFIHIYICSIVTWVFYHGPPSSAKTFCSSSLAKLFQKTMYPRAKIV